MSEATKRFPASVFWSDDDEGFIALAPDLPGCSAFGATAEEALRELEAAKEAWLEATSKAGNPIPKPSAPPSDPQHSGKVLLRMPRELHTQLARTAEAQGVSLNQYLVYLLASSAGASPVTLGTSMATSPIALALSKLSKGPSHPTDPHVYAAVGALLREYVDPQTFSPRAASTDPSHIVGFARGGEGGGGAPVSRWIYGSGAEAAGPTWVEGPFKSLKAIRWMRASTAETGAVKKHPRTRRSQRAE